MISVSKPKYDIRHLIHSENIYYPPFKTPINPFKPFLE